MDRLTENTPLPAQSGDARQKQFETDVVLKDGYRGGPRYDVPALEQLILRIGILVEEIHEIVELDLNPVMVLPEGGGVSLVDVRIRVAETLPPLPFGAKKR